MPISTSLVGDLLDSSTVSFGKWQGGVLAFDGCIYAAPCNSKRILKIDPDNCLTSLVGPVITEPGIDSSSNYYGGTEAVKGLVYFVPSNAKQVLKFNVSTRAVESVGDEYPGDTKWQGGAIGKDGCMYCAPCKAHRILKVDPSSDSTSLVGDDLGHMSHKYNGAVASEDKTFIYFIPSNSVRILKYHIETQECTFIPIDVAGDPSYKNCCNWAGGALGPDGCIYGIPCSAKKFLRYDPSIPINVTPRIRPTYAGEIGFRHENLTLYGNLKLPQNPTVVGDAINGRMGNNYSGGASARDGCIYGIPCMAEKVIRYNIQEETTTRVGDDYTGALKWQGGVLDKKGNIIGIPLRHQKVLRIVPESTPNHQVGGIGDSPNRGTDRLGYELYAEALVEHIVSVEETGEAVSAGLFAPWGSGKSFFWRLIKEAFMAQNREELVGDDGKPPWSIEEYIDRKIGDWRPKLTSWHLYLPILAASLFLGWVVKIITILFRAFFCCYRSEKWKMEEARRNSTNPKRIYIEFDTWTYRGTDNLWASMLEEMWTKVEDELGKDSVKWHRAGVELADSKLSDTDDQRFEKEKVAKDKLRVKWNASVAFFAWASIAFTVAAVHLIDIQTSRRNEDLEENEAADLNGVVASNFLYLASVSLFAALVTLILKLHSATKLLKSGMERIADSIKSHERKSFKDDTGFMGMVRKEVIYLFDFLKMHNARIVLFVDDLDRCGQSEAMEVLWAISLLFGSTDGPITSFLAVDTKILVDFIRDDFGGKVNGYRYLEKIINLPFSIPPLDDKQRLDFCERTIGNQELQLQQVYLKALNCKFRGTSPILFEHLQLKKKNDEGILVDLVQMGQKMNVSGTEDLMWIDDELLSDSEISERPSKQEKLLSVLLANLDIIENGNGSTTDESRVNTGDAKIDQSNIDRNGVKVRSGDKNDTGDINTGDKNVIKINADKPIAEDRLNDNDAVTFINVTDSRYDLFYKNRSMVTLGERKFIKKYAHFLDVVPRKIKRILNMYSVSRNIAKKEKGGYFKLAFLEKMFFFAILQELCPYRTSWLLFISECAERDTGRTKTRKDECISLRSMLDDLRCEGNLDEVQKLDLITVHTRIATGLLHCLPSANKLLDADSGVMYYEELLENLVLGDLFSGGLRKYAFNLPRSMMSEIRMNRNHCVIGKRNFKLDRDESYWVAGFRKRFPLNNALPLEPSVHDALIADVNPTLQTNPSG